MIRRMLVNLWWSLRGIGVEEYRGLCARCHTTGQLHYGWRTVFVCIRFKGISL